MNGVAALRRPELAPAGDAPAGPGGRRQVNLALAILMTMRDPGACAALRFAANQLTIIRGEMGGRSPGPGAPVPDAYDLERAERMAPAAVDAAIGQATAGVSGPGRRNCRKCGEETEAARRQAAPSAQRCLPCQSERVRA